MTSKKDFALLTSQEKAWLVESDAFRYEESDFETAELADWPDELAFFELMEQEDPDFDEKLAEWFFFVLENELWLVLEQCCDQGQLLSPEMRFSRLRTCPKNMQTSFDNLLRACPGHVLHKVARIFFYMVKIDRVNRGRPPAWCPNDGPFEYPEEIDWLIKYEPRRYSN